MGTELTYVCATCGSERLKVVQGEYGTGVFAPDGGEERRYYEAVKCLDCGAMEEL